MRFLTDENFNNHIYRALLLQRPELDVIRLQDVGLSGSPDEVVLQWAFENRRLLLTHDVRTIPALANDLLAENRKIPGILLVPQLAAVGQIVFDLFLIVDCSKQNEWDGKVFYLPF